MAELLQQLESNNKQVVEAAKQKIVEQFNTVRDSWLLNGLYDFYLSTNSAKIIAILVNIREPHHQYLFERLSDSIGKTSKIDVKVQALTLLGHIVRSQPTWLYKLTEHQLLKDILKLLKLEVDILPLMSALLVLIVLIPMIPYSMGELLTDIFEIFSRLASWSYNPGKQIEDQMIHMQIALYALFVRLYGMFPCNFLAYLRTQYKDKNRPVFVHTIKPMLETVKMNPSLVTTSKDNEIASERWRKMAVHDVIVECEKYTLDTTDTFCAHDSCQITSGFRSRSGTSNAALEASYLQSLKTFAASMSDSDRNEFFTPSMILNETNPSMSGIAITTFTPQQEFTHDENVVPQAGSSPPEAAIEATPETTPVIQEGAEYSPLKHPMKSLSNSQPQSPAKKEPSPFFFPNTSCGGGKDEIMLTQVAPKTVAASSQMKPINVSPQKSRFAVEECKVSPSKSTGSSSTDQEEIMLPMKRHRGDHTGHLKQSDSVLHESEDSTSDNVDEGRSSPCVTGGLHMPNSKSMKDFAIRVRRLRHHSQCNTDELTEVGDNSPEMSCENSTKVRRANSCPEMKKSPVSSLKDNISRTFDETDEDLNLDRAESGMSNGVDALSDVSLTTHRKLVVNETQTENFWPMPYEHLFLGIFPTLGTDSNSSPGPQTGTGGTPLDRQNQPVIYDVLDKYVESAIREYEKDDVKKLKNHLQLLHQQLLFERHRKEMHASKNRRFLADAKNTQVLEEHNSALRDQVQLQQNDIDALRQVIEDIKQEQEAQKKDFTNVITTLKEKCQNVESHNKNLVEVQTECSKQIEELKNRSVILTVEKQNVESALLDAKTELKIAKDQVLAGEKGRGELEFVNKQVILLGELQLKYRERLEQLSSLRRSDQELDMLKDSYANEIKALHQHLRDKVTKLDSAASRITDLEQILVQKDEIISLQKRTLNAANEETEEKFKALESKYQTQLTVSRSLEEKILEMYRQLEMYTVKCIRSPDTSSCQEVQVFSDKGSGGAVAVSQRSSPLSMSLTSSDGSLAVAQPAHRSASDDISMSSKVQGAKTD